MSFLDPPALTKKKADLLYARPAFAYPVEIPAGMRWDHDTFPIELGIVQSFGLAPQHGLVNYTPEGLFSLRSNAYSNPFATFWVSASGSDSNPGTEALPVRSIGKAQALANATGTGCTVMVLAGTYPRANNPRNNASVSVVPAVDTVFIAYGGKVVTGTFDNYATPSVDGTYTNCYKLTLLGACDRVVNRLSFDAWGDYVAFRKVATPTVCNATPNSWCAVVNGASFDIYVNRADGLAVTNANTRTYRTAAATYIMGPQVNVMFTTLDGASGWDMEGSNNNGIIDMLCTSPAATPGCSVFKSIRFQQAGGEANGSARALSGNSFNGLLAAFNCHGGNPATDIFNIHNNYGAAKAAVLLVNCTGDNPGIAGNQSCNGFTLHEDAIGIDLCGTYREAHGGTIANIGTSTCLLAGTYIENDRGDAVLGGGGQQVPVAIMAKDTAQIWCDSVKIKMPAGTWAYATNATAGATIHRRNCFPVGQPDAGGGTFTTY